MPAWPFVFYCLTVKKGPWVNGRFWRIVLKKSANWRFWIGQCDSARVLDCA